MVGEQNGNAVKADDRMFIRKIASKYSGARLGSLRLPGRNPISTPHYIANTSRGAVPHIAQDVFTDSTGIQGVYVAVEDFIEKAPKQIPPVLSYTPKDGSSSLRRFIVLPDDTLLVLGPRRVPPIKSPISNTTSSIPIFTSVGFSQLPVMTYTDIAMKLRPDIVIGVADIPFGAETFSKKRSESMTDRSPHWMTAQVKTFADSDSTAALFAPILPLPVAQQRWYLDELANHVPDTIKGLAVYDAFALEDLPESLDVLPKISFSKADGPQAVLRQIAQGLDVFTIPFISTASDAGIALSFSFPGPLGEDTTPQPLGIDLWLESHAADLSPLSRACTCYACTDHHRAFVRHLLSAKEMLGWGLLQIHNHHVVDLFFDQIRKSIERGTFDQDCLTFERLYEPTLPTMTGQGPRLRGYQYRSEGPGEVKRNKAAFNTLDDVKARVAESAETNPIDDVQDIAASGLAEKI